MSFREREADRFAAKKISEALAVYAELGDRSVYRQRIGAIRGSLSRVGGADARFVSRADYWLSKAKKLF